METIEDRLLARMSSPEAIVELASLDIDFFQKNEGYQRSLELVDTFRSASKYELMAAVDFLRLKWENACNHAVRMGFIPLYTHELETTGALAGLCLIRSAELHAPQLLVEH